jgi:hypothetical protein
MDDNDGLDETVDDDDDDDDCGGSGDGDGRCGGDGCCKCRIICIHFSAPSISYNNNDGLFLRCSLHQVEKDSQLLLLLLLPVLPATCGDEMSLGGIDDGSYRTGLLL